MKFVRALLLSLPAIVCMLVIFRFSAQTAQTSASESGSLIHDILSFISPAYSDYPKAQQNEMVESLQFFVRKGAHFSIYAVLAVLCTLPYSVFVRKPIPCAVFAFCTAVLYAVTDEIHQYLVPGRSCELRDVLIDASGAVFGLLLYFAVCSLLRKFLKSHSHSSPLS